MREIFGETIEEVVGSWVEEDGEGWRAVVVKEEEEEVVVVLKTSSVVVEDSGTHGS